VTGRSAAAEPSPEVLLSARSSPMQRPNLPPQQSSQNQVQIDGKIRLARHRGRRVRANHEKAAR
jgi:hypothetical protein